MSIRNSVPNVPHISMGDTGDKILTPFGPMIYQTFLSDDDINLLLSEGTKLSRQENDYNFNLAGNLKKGRSLQYSEQFIQEFSPVIMKKANTFVSGVSKTFGFRLPQPENLSLFDLWINYQKQYDFNPMHTHAHFLSFVIYCDVPQTIFEQQADTNMPLAGSIVFHYGDAMTPLSNQSFSVQPENNLMFIFPAKLHHLVYPFFSDETRISVAGNIVCNYSV